MQIPKAEYDAILGEIANDQSPVGIDARHTHILILHKLLEIERRLTAIEARMADNEPRQAD